MLRKEKVYIALRELCKDITLQDIEEGFPGFDASTVGSKAGVNRNNTSKELNILFTEGRVIKVPGRPVYFIDRNKIEELLGSKIKDEDLELDSIKELFKRETERAEGIADGRNAFDKIIGAHGSLKIPIEQAKAAVLYPPMGLHTLLIGPTGVGKTTFAEMMYQYAVETGRLRENAPFTIFNCSEYADNPQLLLSQLFGYVKGAFTGADKDKPGLVEKTDGGLLLLDEIHRLTPEGQEMLFLLIDRGIYRRLGETENVRKANILLVGATTENLDSSLLRTFLRRIPMVIKLPSLSERPLSERLRLIKQFFKDEVKRVQVPIRVFKDVIKAFLLYECKGNIGQLRGDIQLTCARGFLEYKTYNRKTIDVDVKLLPDYVYEGLLNSKENRDEIVNLLQLDNKKFYTFSNFAGEDFSTVDDYSISEDLYKEIGEKWNIYTQKGYSQKQIREIINSQIEGYFKKLLNRGVSQAETPGYEELFKVVSPRVVNAVEVALKVAEQKLKREFGRQVIFGLSMHIGTLLERLRDGRVCYNTQINQIALNNPREFHAARLVRKVLEEELEIEIPKEEIGFISMFLYAASSKDHHKNKNIGVIVLAHGENTASSMAEVANSLLGTQHAKAIDMPLDERVEDVLKTTIELVKQINNGKGVLLLVDMGSLVAFAEIITKKTGIKTFAVEMVSTPMVIEAVRKSLLPEMTLEQLVEDIQQISPYIGRLVTENVKNKASIVEPRTIITTCLTGEGTAVKLAELLRKSLPLINEYNIQIRHLNAEKKKDLKIKKEDILAVIGTINLDIPGVPFIPVDEIIIGDGFKRLEKIISGMTVSFKNYQPSEFNVITKILGDTLVFLNPNKAYELVDQSFQYLIESLKVKECRELKIKYIFHNSCMLERVIKGEKLPYKNIDSLKNTKRELYSIIKKAMTVLEENFGVEIPDTEIGYIMDLVDTH
jgi:transcriptional regulatory protein LevR/transcriptional regulator with AAA-type ATPase domain